MFRIGDEEFQVAKATISMEVRYIDDARAVGVPPCNFTLDIACEDRVIREPDQLPTTWQPRVYLDPPLPVFGRSVTALDGLTGTPPGALYVLEHRKLETTKLHLKQVSDLDFDVVWEGKSSVRSEVTVSIALRATFGSVTVHEVDPGAAGALLRTHLTEKGLVRQPPFLHQKGRKKWFVYGQVIGRIGYVKYLPEAALHDSKGSAEKAPPDGKASGVEKSSEAADPAVAAAPHKSSAA